MKCPFCKHADTQVIDSRENDEGDSIRRRRRCLSCDKRFTTYERVELQMPQVVKQNGNRAEFDVDKLRKSFRLALHKRPVSTEQVEAAIDQVTQQVFALGEREIGSEVIGGMVMEALRKLDKVAFIRFASVYEGFEDVGDFADAIKALGKSPRRPRTPVTH